MCVVNQLESSDAEYFDSFGVPQSDVVVNYMKTSGKGLVYSDNHIQDVDSIMCGYYVLFYHGAGKGAANERHPSRLFEPRSERADD